MSTEMTEQEAQKLFNAVSGSIKDNDQTKLGELLAEPVIEAEVPDDNTPTEEIPAEVPDETKVEEVNTPPEETKAEEKPVEEETVPSESKELSELRAQLEKVAKENHALKSQAGRVPHVQRRLKELDQKLEELTKKSASPSNRPSATIQPKVLEALKGIRDTDAELADTIAAAIAQATEGVSDEFLSRERENLTSQRAQTYSDYQDGEASRLLEMYPNAKEVFNSPTWKEWKQTQPAGIQGLADSDSADEVSYAFKKYAEDMVTKYPDLAKTTVTPPEAVKPVDPKAAQIEEERARKKAASVTVSTPNASGRSAMPSDPKALFEQYSAQIRKEISGG